MKTANMITTTIVLCLCSLMLFDTTIQATPNRGVISNSSSDSQTLTQSELENLQERLMKLQRTLKQKEEILKEREKSLDERESNLAEREKSIDQTSTTNTSKFIEGVNLKRIGTVSDLQMMAVLNGFHALPTAMQDIIVANNYRIEVTDEDIEKLITGAGTNSWYGATAGHPLFVIIIATNQTTADITRTTMHECGHALDNSLGVITNLPDFQQIYASESKTLYHTADVHDASEWFAECVVYYIQNPMLLKQTAPLSYQYMTNLFTNFVNQQKES